jgi:glutathione S-transferase
MNAEIKTLTRLLDEAMTLAGEAWELADAYAGGQSENADALAKKLDKLQARIDRVTTE